jgi:hypothetical protein
VLIHRFSLLLTIGLLLISLEPRALLNAEFQHFIQSCSIFIVRFNKNVFTLQIPLKDGIGGGKRRPKDRVKTGSLYG